MTEQHRFECECRQWLAMTAEYGRDWWHGYQKPRLIRIRGQAAVDRLCAGINAEVQKNK